MEKATILAKIRASIDFSDESYSWLEKLPEDIWIRNTEAFFSEFNSVWKRTLIDSAEPIILDYFRELGIQEKNLPKIKIYETFKGSWIVEAALILTGSIGTAYSILKVVSEIPKIVKGLSELKDLIKTKFNLKANKEATTRLKSIGRRNIPNPPQKVLRTDFSIDARPMLSLTPSKMKSHKIHLNVAVSIDSLTIENLGDRLIKDIQIGIFKDKIQRHQWTYQESYMGTINMLSPHQTIAKDCTEFRNNADEPLDLMSSLPSFVDCWVQDSHGIYLFNFYLER